MNKLRIGMLLLAASASCFAQQWEVGGTGGAAFLPGVNISSPLGSATTGFKPGITAGAYVGQNLYPHISGEIHYGFLQSNLKLQSGGTEATFSGLSTSCTTTWSCTQTRRIRAASISSLSAAACGSSPGPARKRLTSRSASIAYLTKTQELKPMASVGAGVKYKLSPRVILRTEFRDYITPFPQTLIAPAPGAKIGSILHTFVPMVGIVTNIDRQEPLLDAGRG